MSETKKIISRLSPASTDLLKSSEGIASINKYSPHIFAAGVRVYVQAL
jgi:hypothetical protein